MKILCKFYAMLCLCALPLAAQVQQQISITSKTTTTQNRAIITVPVAASGTSSRTVMIRFPQGTNPGSVKARLNGKDVSIRFKEETCSGAVCVSADLSAVDGVVSGNNVVYATAKNQDGTASSSRVHFTDGDTTQAAGVQAFSRTQAAALQAVTSSNLPTNSTFLPPSVLFQSLANGGVGASQPWFTLGSLQQVVNGNCTSTYSVVVLDRRTLQQKTSAPESSPQCFNNSLTLVPYLKSLAGNNDIVIVGTNQGKTTDAGGFVVTNPLTAFDTSSIGGTVYCPGCTGKAVFSTDNPLTYLAIGVPGAASGSAYENYTTSTNNGMASFATGMFVEDATGNYNFVSSNNVEFTVSPGTNATNTSVTVVNAPSALGLNVVYGPPTNAANGFWLLVLDRVALASAPGCAQGSTTANTISIPNCGTFFALGGPNGGTISTVNALATALASVDSGHIAILTTVGTAGWGTPAFMASDNDTPNGTIPLATALQSYGIPDKSILNTGTTNSTWTMVGTPGLGGPLNGHNLLSSSFFGQQGHTGYIHGTFARNNNGLYEPSHSEQQLSTSDSANLQLGLITAQQPQEWPEYSALTGATSIAGQVDAYKYLSWYLLNGWYLSGQATSTTSQNAGVTGTQQYDIHYFFTGSLNTLLDYHTFDPLDAVFPAGVTADHRTVPCSSTSGTSPVTCTWKSPDGMNLTFTSNDFAAVQVQLHNELVALNNVLTYMVTGSTNMKDIVAAGNSNAALALIQAMADVQANISEPLPPAAPVTVSPWHIMHMIASDVSPFISFATDGVVNPADIALADKAIGFVGDLFNSSGGTGGGLNTIDTNEAKQIPRLDYKLDVAIGQLATTDLQGAILAGFDSTLDVITGDWGKLNALGGAPAAKSALFSPTQATQNQVIQMITKASQKSLYASLIPQIYQVHKWGMTGNTATADMGYTKTGDTGSCRAFYDNTTTAWVAVPYPTYGGTSYWESWHASVNADATYPFFNNSGAPWLDWYVLSLPFSGAGSTNASAKAMDGTLSSILFGAGQSSVNFVRDEFVASQGPMDKPLTGGKSAMFDLAFEVDGTNSPYSPFTNPIGLDNYNICSVSQFSAVQVGSGPQTARQTTTALSMPGSAVLGSGVTLQAKVSVTSTSPAATGSVQFFDGNTVLSTVALDATGSASYTAQGLQLGSHSMAAYFISTDGSLPSDSGVQTLTVYANGPDMQLTLSQSTLNVSYGKTSSAVSLKVLSQSGMSGTVSYACSGLPAGMTCTFSPASNTITDGATATTSFNITGTAITAASITAPSGWRMILSGSALLILLTTLRRKRSVLSSAIFPLLLLTLVTGSILGCSGGTAKDASFQETGLKTVLVTATSGTVSKTIPLVVTIQ